jgi:nucleoside-diphosphate-sugar epimerase
MKVLVTGATGFLGKEVVRRLTEDGLAITVFTRPNSETDAFGKLHPARAVGDVTDPSSLQDAANGQDAIVHCAALLGPATESDLTRVNVDGTRNVARAASRSKVPHVIHMSSVGVYGGPTLGPPRNEETPLLPDNHYSRSKLLAESAMRDELAPTSKLTIVRPAGLYGPGRDLYRSWITKLKRRRVVLDFVGSEMVHPCHVRDVSNVVSKALREPPEGGSTVYNVAGERPLSLSEMRYILVGCSGFNLRVVTLPAFLAAPVVRFVATAKKWRPEKLEFTMARARGQFPGAVYDTRKVERELKATWTSLNDGLREMVAEF